MTIEIKFQDSFFPEINPGCYEIVIINGQTESAIKKNLNRFRLVRKIAKQLHDFEENREECDFVEVDEKGNYKRKKEF